MTRVLVLGDLNLDVRAEVPQDVPWGEEARTLVQVTPGGSAGNFARAARREGADVLFIGCVGDDAIGDLLVESLETLGIETCVKRATGPSGTILALWKGVERTMFCSRGANDGLDAAWIEEALFVKADHLHLSGYAFLSSTQRTAARRAIALARKRGLTISVDPPPASLIRDFGVTAFRDELASVNWIFPNLEEGRTLSGKRAPERIVDSLAQSFAVGALTLGGEGSLAWSGSKRSHAKVTTIATADTTGAGDAFAAGFVVMYLRTHDIQQAVERGNGLATQLLVDSDRNEPAQPTGIPASSAGNLDRVDDEVRGQP